MRNRYRFLVGGCAVFLAAAGLMALLGGKRPPKMTLVAKASFHALKIDVAAPNPGEITFKASWDYTNPFRDAFYTYAVKIMDRDGAVAWEHVYNNLQGAPKDKPATIVLDLQRVPLAAGTYRVYAEVREDAREVDREGNVLSPYHHTAGNTSAAVQVN
jgi:hypothetical protein